LSQRAPRKIAADSLSADFARSQRPLRLNSFLLFDSQFRECYRQPSFALPTRIRAGVGPHKVRRRAAPAASPRCRNLNCLEGWSDPAFFTIEGGSFGLQIGGQAVDLVMLIMNNRGMQNLLNSKFKLGADASVAAGPVGRHAAADTDWRLRAQVLSYSRARGVFAGLELNGAVVKIDRESTLEFYGHMQPFSTTLTTVSSPAGALPFLQGLAKWAKIASK